MEDGPALGVVQRRGPVENAQDEADEHEAGERLQAQAPADITATSKQNSFTNTQTIEMKHLKIKLISKKKKKNLGISAMKYGHEDKNSSSKHSG